MKPANNPQSRSVTAELVAERITGRSDPSYISSDMQRGMDDEPYARDVYAEHYAPVDEIGIMIRDYGGYQIGFSPDGLVGSAGLIEIKSRRPKVHVQTILNDQVPTENMAQLQTGLLVSGREWIDYVSYAGGMPLYVKRVYPDPVWHDAIQEAVQAFEENAEAMINRWRHVTRDMPPTEWIDHYQEVELQL